MNNTVIVCPNCKGTVGDYLGIIKDNTGEKFLHKCMKCKQHVKMKKSEGLNYA